jgi:pyruvate/2-oxoglutarate dehydrogenase complex dihydrolipoamide acyltransferase (E2) component
MKDEMPRFRVRRILSKPAKAAAPAAAEPAPDVSAEPTRPTVPSTPSGRVQFDDRGNAVWDWALRTARLERGGASQPLKVLENPTLSLAEDAPTPTDVVKPNPLGIVKGYNPYDSGKLDRKKKGPEPKKDLRKLSEWIQLRKQAASNKPIEE